jgi:maltose O-acetyltransferase
MIGWQLHHVGENIVCDQNVVIYGGENISLGNRVVLNRGVILQSCDGSFIKIGNNVTLSYDTKIITGNLSVESLIKENIHQHSSNSITVGDNVWVGANAIILPGVSISNNTIIAAGSIVSKSILEEFQIYGGVPAKKIKSLI